MIPIAKPLIGEKEKELVSSVLDSGVIAQGPKVKEFEDEFAEYIGVDYAVAVSSGTAAIHLSLMAHGIGSGDEVITTPFTFIASANAVLFCNARPVFVDIEKDSFNIDPEKIADGITKETKALLPVHLYGHPADMKEIIKIAEDHNLVVLEDACQAHGAEINNKKVGSFSTGSFSFYPTKNMTTGEGGMITTSDEEIAGKLRMLRAHGSKERYVHEMLGFNMRMTDIAAAIGIAQLLRLVEFNNSRIRNAVYLTDKLRNVDGLVTPGVREGVKHVFHQYTIRVMDEFRVSRDELITILTEKGIGSGIHYPVPVHKQPLYRDLGYAVNLPVSEGLAREVLSLPIHPSVTKEDLDYIADTISSI
ncbi:MAG: DegT/DnrJ/EryC1/StrS family aminotransferase [Candidatus Altiarchaeota archaeon]|nr:DegT/DnrJ/EryC1/StrS family aminotransferase [Candidatus Altiarchaeota archaeon]